MRNNDVQKSHKMKNVIFIFLFTGILSHSYANFTDKPPIKWGKVSKSEFEVNSFHGDSSVPAIVLCDYGEINITNRTFYTRHVRIKINNEQGIRYSNIEIPYQFKEKHDDILTLKVHVFNIENGEITKYKFSKNDFKTVTVDKKLKKKVLEATHVKRGSIIEYYYEIASLDFVKLDDWYFQREIPTLWSEIRMDIPSSFYYLVTYQNGEFLSRKEQLKYAKKLEWLYNTKWIKRRVELDKANRILYESPSANYKVYVINNMQKKIVMKNLPGVSMANGFISVKDYYPKLRFDLYESSGRLPWFYRPLLLTTLDDYDAKSRRELMYSSRMTGYVQYKLDTWEEFNTKLLESERFGMQLIKHFDYAPVFDKILTTNMTPKEKMVAIYDFIREYLTWNQQYDIYIDRGLVKPFEKKEASSGEINMLLVYLFRRAGLKSDPVLIRTNDLGKPETVYPVYNQFNHVIAMVEIDGEMFLLDATHKNSPYSELPEKDLYTTGWRVNRKEYGWIDINPPKAKNQNSKSSTL